MKLYVGNVSYSATEEGLANWLAEYGIAANSVTLVRDRLSGELRGFGFVEVSNPDEGQAMIHNCHGQKFMGRGIVISEARPKIPPARSATPQERPEGNRHWGGRQERRRESRW